MPARWPRKVRKSLKDGTEYMFMVASAEAVARRVWSGESLTEVMPRAWARGRVLKGLNLRLLVFRGSASGGL